MLVTLLTMRSAAVRRSPILITVIIGVYFRSSDDYVTWHLQRRHTLVIDSCRHSSPLLQTLCRFFVVNGQLLSALHVPRIDETPPVSTTYLPLHVIVCIAKNHIMILLLFYDMRFQKLFYRLILSIKAKFHYASWFEDCRRPTSNQLA